MAAPVEEPSAPKVGEALTASARCKTAPGDGSSARMPEGAVAAFADTAAMPVAASDNAVEGTAASYNWESGSCACWVGFTMPCRACLRDPFLHDSPVLLISIHDEDDSCALYLVDCSAWPILRELLGCSIPCLREHLVVVLV